MSILIVLAFYYVFVFTPPSSARADWVRQFNASVGRQLELAMDHGAVSPVLITNAVWGVLGGADTTYSAADLTYARQALDAQPATTDNWIAKLLVEGISHRMSGITDAVEVSRGLVYMHVWDGVGYLLCYPSTDLQPDPVYDSSLEPPFYTYSILRDPPLVRSPLGAVTASKFPLQPVKFPEMTRILAFGDSHYVGNRLAWLLRPRDMVYMSPVGFQTKFQFGGYEYDDLWSLAAYEIDNRFASTSLRRLPSYQYTGPDGPDTSDSAMSYVLGFLQQSGTRP